MEKVEKKIKLAGLFGVYLYGISLIVSKGGVNIGLGLMTLSALFFIKDFKFNKVEKEYKIFLVILILIPVFDSLSPGGLKSAKVTLSQMYRFLPLVIAPIFLISLKEIKRFMYLVSFSVLINCIYGINLYKNKNWDFNIRYESFTTIMDSAHALVGLSFVVLALVAIEIKDKNYRRLSYLFPVYILNLACIVLSQTRGAWLALIGGIGVFLLLALSKKQILISLVVSALVVGIGVTIFKDNSYIKRFQSISNVSDSSPKTRLLMWKASKDIYIANPIFGVGKDNSPKYYLDYFEKNKLYDEFHEWDRPMVKMVVTAGNAHNMYFENLVNMGSLFFVLLGFWIFMLYKSVVQTLKLSKKSSFYWISLGATSMMMVYYITGLTEGAWGEFIKRHIYLVSIILYIACKKNGVICEKNR